MKRIVCVVFALLILLTACLGAEALLCGNLFENDSATANSAYVAKDEGGSGGIVFTKSENIGIQSEVLSIDFDLGRANVSAVYQMHNYSLEAQTADAMFIASVKAEQEGDYTLKINDTPIPYTTEFYAPLPYATSYNYESEYLMDWETIIGIGSSRPNPFGDGTGYCLLTIKSHSRNSEISVNFDSFAPFFLTGASASAVQNTVWLSGYDSLTLLTKETKQGQYDDYDIQSLLSLNSDAYIASREQIPDLYSYLYENGKQYAENEELRFYDSQFNHYLYSMIEGAYTFEYARYGYPYFYPSKLSGYIEAVRYSLSFAPEETISVSVSYSQPLSASSSMYFNYYLSPIKYWRNLDGLTVNLTLCDEYPIISYSSLSFEKTGINSYTSSMTELIDRELIITLRKPSIFGDLTLLGTALVILIPLALVSTYLIIMIKNHFEKNTTAPS